MRDPTGEEDGRGCLLQVCWTESESACMEEIPHVVKRHQYHHHTSQEVNAVKSFFFGHTMKVAKIIFEGIERRW